MAGLRNGSGGQEEDEEDSGGGYTVLSVVPCRDAGFVKVAGDAEEEREAGLRVGVCARNSCLCFAESGREANAEENANADVSRAAVLRGKRIRTRLARA